MMRKWITLEIALLLAFVIPIVPRSGEDYRIYYQPLARGCLDCGFNPPYASLILKPIAIIPWYLWPAITLALLFWSTCQIGGDPLKLVTAFPTIGLLGLGQIEGVLAVGLVLALVSPFPGLGLILLSVKPQVTGPLMLWVLWHNPRAFISSFLFFLVTLTIFGISWPIDWLLHTDRPTNHSWMLASWFPYGLVLLLISPIWKRGPLSILAASALAMPHFSAYSHALFFLFSVPWWLTLLTWICVLFLPLLGMQALIISRMVPFCLLCWIHRERLWLGFSNVL